MHGRILVCITYQYIALCRRLEFSEGRFKRAEVHFPNMFTSNRRTWRDDKFPDVPMQYLQHSTHSEEKDSIWKEDIAKLRGYAKKASLQIPIDESYVRVTTWKQCLEENYLQQLHIKMCDCCRGKEHQCSGCCTSSANESTSEWSHYAKLALLTCKPTGGTCNGEECKKVEKLFPGSYVWFGIPDRKEDTPQQVVGEQEENEEEQFKRH